MSEGNRYQDLLSFDWQPRAEDPVGIEHAYFHADRAREFAAAAEQACRGAQGWMMTPVPLSLAQMHAQIATAIVDVLREEREQEGKQS